MANPSLVTAPGLLLTLDEVKDHLRIEQDDKTQDFKLWAFLNAAIATAQNMIARRFVTQTLNYTLDRFPAGGFITLPGGILQDPITSLIYTDSDAVATEWTASNYFAVTSHEPGRLHLSFNISWPSVTLRPADGIVIKYIVGYGRGDEVPEDIRTAVLLIVGDLWENREDSVIGQGLTPVSIPRGAENLLMPYKIHYF